MINDSLMHRILLRIIMFLRVLLLMSSMMELLVLGSRVVLWMFSCGWCACCTEGCLNWSFNERCTCTGVERLYTCEGCIYRCTVN